MKTTLVSGWLMVAATAFAASNVHKVDIGQDCVIEGKTVKAGQYKISVVAGNAVLTQGRQSMEVPAREVTDPYKVVNDQLTYDDNANLKSIRLGGTNLEIVFEGAVPAQPAL